MPYAKLKAELLAARDRREAALREALGDRHRTLLQLSLNLPGADKRPAGAGALFCWAQDRLHAELPALLKLAENRDSLGPWALYAGQSPATATKRLALTIEAALPAGRLLDIDVYDRQGKACDRKQLGLPPRRCLLCGEAARDCIRLQRHGAGQLKARIDDLLTPFRA
jgi:holo-ACP synthase CitX